MSQPITSGSAYFGKGDYDDAIADFRRAITLDPNLASERWDDHLQQQQ